MIKLNYTAKSIVDLLSTSDLSYKQLINMLLEEYDVDIITLEKSVIPILEELNKSNVY